MPAKEGRKPYFDTPEKIKELTEKCREFLTVKQIAEYFNVNDSTLKFIIKRLGIVRPDMRKVGMHWKKKNLYVTYPSGKTPKSYKDYLAQKGLKLRRGLTGFYAVKVKKEGI